jgi:hypothetical protein
MTGEAIVISILSTAALIVIIYAVLTFKRIPKPHILPINQPEIQPLPQKQSLPPTKKPNIISFMKHGKGMGGSY